MTREWSHIGYAQRIHFGPGSVGRVNEVVKAVGGRRVMLVTTPTTYSGAELTPHSGMTDEGTRRKTGAGGPTIAPIAAIYDPELTIDTPPEVSAQTGMNALAHGVECAYSPSRTPEAEAVA